MKRIITLIITAILITISVSGLSACNKNGDSGNNKNAEVTLLKLSAGASSNARYKRNKSAYSTENADLTPDSSIDENDLEFPKDSYTIIYKSQTEINFDILLSNPKNYYIMDFKLTCDDEQIYYYDDKMDKWNCINDIWIRWSGSNNQESRYRLRLPNPEVSPDKIRVSEMYYSDRTDGTNKTAVNMNNKETYRVYKVEDELLTTKTVENTLSAYRFEVIKKEGVVITSIRDDENNIDLVADSDGTYRMEKDGRIRIEYEKLVDGVKYSSWYTKDIEKLKLISTKYYDWDAAFDAYYHDFQILYDYEGTDVDSGLYYFENEKIWPNEQLCFIESWRYKAKSRSWSSYSRFDFSTKEKCINFLENTYWLLGNDKICLYDIIGENFEYFTEKDEYYERYVWGK